MARWDIAKRFPQLLITDVDGALPANNSANIGKFALAQRSVGRDQLYFQCRVAGNEPSWFPIADADVSDGLASDVQNTNATLNSAGRGLAAPNPGVLRLFPVLDAMSDPPDIAEGSANGATVITNSVLVPAASPQFVYGGCKADAFGEFYPNTARYSPIHVQAPYGGALINVASTWTVDFDWYGSEFEIELAGSSTAAYRLLVDELGYDDRTGRSELPSDGNTYLIHYDFGSTAFRRIRFDFSSTVKFGGVRIEPSASIWRSSKNLGPKVIVTGDSFAEGDYNSWPFMMGELMGWRNVTAVGRGSTGYLDTNEGGDTFRQRAQKDIYNQSPEIVVVSGGINDSQNTDYAAVQTEAGAFYAEIKENLPNCILVVSGMQWPSGSPNQQQLKVGFAIRDAALGTSAVDCYIDQLGLGTGAYSGSASDYVNQGWITGTGKVGSTTGSGNADLFTSADGTHPSQAGYDYRGWRHASALVAQMPIGGA